MSLTTRMGTSALVALTALAIPVAAFADNSFQAHEQLLLTVRRSGAKVYLNHPAVCDGKISGAYISGKRALVICQDKSTEPHKEVEWTANDLDTVRHEVQHLVQDCAAFRPGDQTLRPIVGDDSDVMGFALATLGEGKVQSIVRRYSSKGISRREMLIELEAWGTAKVIPASAIAAAVEHYCM
jgi:hypothetical protein